MNSLLSATTIFVLLVLDCVTSENPTQGYPEALARLLYTINGDFIAEKKTTSSDGNTVVNYYNLSVIPVKAPRFTDPTVMYVVSGPGTFFQVLCTFTEDSNKFVHISLYELRKTDILKSHEVDNGVPFLPLDADIKHLTKCQAFFEEEESGIFTGYWEDCMEIKGAEEPVILGRNVTCDSFTQIIDLGTATVVLNFVRHGERYPLPPEVENMMKSTDDPCQ